MNVEHQEPIDLGAVRERFLDWTTKAPYSWEPFTITPHVEIVILRYALCICVGLEAHACDPEHPDWWLLVFRPEELGADDDCPFKGDHKFHGNWSAMERDVTFLITTGFDQSGSGP